MNAGLKAINWYVRHGWSCIPLHGMGQPAVDVHPFRPGKTVSFNSRPYGWNFHRRTRASLETVTEWLETGHNIGIVTGQISGLVVIDLDDVDAVIWAREHLPLTEYRVQTAAGEHWYYRHPGRPVANRVDVRGREIDIRGDGGYVVAPPSQHASGARYSFDGRWRGGLPELPAELLEPPSPFPSPLLLPASSSPWAASACTWSSGHPCLCLDCRLRRAKAWLARVPVAVERQGGDHRTFVTASFLLHRWRLSPAQALELLLPWNARCLPPWSRADLERKVSNAARYGGKHAR